MILGSCEIQDLLRLMKPARKVLLCVLPVVLGLTAGSAAAGLRPDPPPKPPPPVLVPAPPPPAQPQPAPAPVIPAPSVDPSAAARLATARARAERLRAQRINTAQARAAARARRAARRRAQRAAREGTPVAVGSSPLAAQTLLEPKAARAAAVTTTLALSLMVVALLLFCLAAIPAWAVPWLWVLRGLDHRRVDLAFLGIVALLLMAILFLAG